MPVTKRAETHDDYRFRADWLAEQIGMDASLSLTAVRLAAFFAARLNGRTMECFPSQRTCADALGRSEPSILKAIKELEARGHVRVERAPQGSHQVNRYRLVLHTPSGLRVLGGLHPKSSETDTPSAAPSTPQAHLGLNSSLEPWKENAGDARATFDQIFAALPAGSRRGSSTKRMHQAWLKTEDRPSTDDLLIAARAYRQFEGKPQAAHYWIIDETFREFVGDATANDEPNWHRRMELFRRPGALMVWLDSWGPRPGERGCLCPPDIQKQHPPTIGGIPDLGWC